jgi:hypothetical protein
MACRVCLGQLSGLTYYCRAAEIYLEGKPMLSFTSIDSRPPTWVLFVIQAVCVPVIAELLTFSLIFLGPMIEKGLPEMGVIGIGILVTGISFLLGLIVARIAPSLVSVGFWIWIPALSLFTIGLASDLRGLPQYYQGSESEVVAEWFYDPGGDEGGRILLGTNPVYATIAYSIAMFMSKRNRRNRA